MADLSLRGTYTALVTPFLADASAIDWDAYEKLVAGQLEGGVTGLVPLGTTGESPTVTDSEQRELIQRTVALARGRVPVLAGTGSFSTKKTIEVSRAAVEAGADAILIVTPYYSKPSQEGLIRHVTMIAKAVPAPIVLYNVPGRTVVELGVEAVLRILDASPNVVGIKDASANVLYCQDLLRQAGDRISVLSGDDPLTLPLMSVGARGVISVTSNIYPRQVGDVVRAVEAGNWAEARRLNEKLYPVHRVLFGEPSPAPTKTALAMKKLMNDSVRPPLIETSEAFRTTLSRILSTFEGA